MLRGFLGAPHLTHDGVVDVGMGLGVAKYTDLLASQHQSGDILVSPDTRVLDRGPTGSADRFGSQLSRGVVVSSARRSEDRNERMVLVAQCGRRRRGKVNNCHDSQTTIWRQEIAASCTVLAAPSAQGT